MQQMVDTLARFIELDVPFLPRSARRACRTEDRWTARTSRSEKYRLILEAYQIELDYGRGRLKRTKAASARGPTLARSSSRGSVASR